MSFNFTAGRFKAFASDNSPLVGGRLYTYSSGTTTFKAAYTDSTLGTPCTYVNDGSGGLYIALDARGEAQLWIGSGAYTFALKTDTGVTVWTVDHVRDEGAALALDLMDTAPGKGAALVGFQQAGSGAVARTGQDKLREIVSVLDFGAVADGNASTGAGTDNSPFFQAALNHCQSNNKSLYVPAGTYVLHSQVTTGNNNRVFGGGMYRTILVAPTTFTGNGLINMVGAGGPPSVVEHMSIVGQTSTGAGVGSAGLRLAANAALAKDVWVGGFSTQFAVDGTDCRLTNCWADVSLAAGAGFSISNGGNSLLDCTTFNCYTGILIQGGWEVAEPDIEVQITNCNIIQCGYSGISVVNANNVIITNVSIHTPIGASKFTRDFITVTGGKNITVSGVHGNFGNSSSASCIGFRQTGETLGLNVSNCNFRSCSYGMVIENAPLARITGNNFSNCGVWGMKLSGGSAGAVISNNSSWFNGTTNATDGGGYWLVTSGASGRITVADNSAGDFGGTSKYGFYFDCNASAYINATGNAVTNTSNQYHYVGTTNNVINKATNLPATNSIVDAHYQEGDWTPSVFYGATEAGYYSRGGKYTRIGRVVICHMQAYFVRGAGALSIQNLPFTAASFGGNPDILYGVSGRDFSTSTDFQGWVSKGTTQAGTPYTFGGAGDSEIRASIMYIV